MSIIEGLIKIKNEDLKSFHVPGHKNGCLLKHLPFAKEIGSYDTTEIHGTDNLHAPEGIIDQTQKMIAEFYETKESFILINGTTGGIISMIYAAFKPGDKVIISRDAHKSVFTGMIIAQLEPIYVVPTIDLKSGVNLGVSKEAISSAYDENENIKGVILTYPTYHGICTDLSAIEKIVHKKEGILLIDGAHGAHFNLNEGLPKSALAMGADIVVHSTHKSLPAFTQASVLHYCTSRVSRSKLAMALSMFQSTSPSYLLMASVENAIRIAKEEGSFLMHELLNNIKDFEKKLEDQTQFTILKNEDLVSDREIDPTKITVLTHKLSISGGELDECLRKRYGIQCEYGTDSSILFITSIASEKKDLEVLLNALIKISQEIESKKNVLVEAFDHYNYETFKLIQEIKPCDAIHKTRELMALKKSVGEIAGDFIIPYPPGVPIIVPGEVISEQVVNYIEDGIRKGYNINGVHKHKTLRLNIIRR